MLGERLTELRKSLKLTQEEIAKKLHMTRSTYAQYEVDRRVPEYATLQKLADFFNVSIDYLVGRDFNKEPTEMDEINKKLLEGFEKLSLDNKKYLIGLIERMPKDLD